MSNSMDGFHIDLGSMFAGIVRTSTKHLRDPWRFWYTRDGVFTWTAFGVNHWVGFVNHGHKGWGIHIWTPKWHEGRGPYVTACIGTFRFGRGY